MYRKVPLATIVNFSTAVTPSQVSPYVAKRVFSTTQS
jgi:hypothetical protein